MDPTASEPVKPLSNYTPQNDSSKFIRTYAKDFAALSGQALTPTAPELNSVQTDKKIAAETGVALPEYDPSPVNYGQSASPKEFAQEKVDLKETDSEGIFQEQQESEKVPIAPLQTTQPASEPEPDREAILARLRAKVSATRAVETTAPPAAPAIRTAAPDFSQTPEPVLPIPQVKKEPTFVFVPPAPPPALETPSPLHTYSSDFADRIDTEKGTAFSVLAAQSDTGQTPKPAPRKRSLAPLFAGGAMLIIGIIAVGGAYLFTRHGSIVPPTSVPSLIAFDESVEVKGTGQTLMQAISDVGQGGSVPGNLIVTYVTLATSTGSGIPQPGGVLLRELSLQAPSILLRNSADSSTVGVVRAGSESRPFIILKVNSYERTFAGMLAWEPSMARDLATFYPAYPGSSMGAGSTSPRATLASPTSFSDAVVANYDVRILRDASGRSLMLYGYRGKDTLIIARDEAAFAVLISRLNSTGN